MSLLDSGFTRNVRPRKRNKPIIESQGTDGEEEEWQQPESEEEPAVLIKKGKVKPANKQAVVKAAKQGPSDSDIDSLLRELRQHPHREAVEDNTLLKTLLRARLEECVRLTQLHRFQDRGFSAFEALPTEVLTVIAGHLHRKCDKGQFKHFALLSKTFSVVVRTMLWKHVEKFRSGTVTKLKNDILPSVGSLIRKVNAEVKSREAQVVVEGAPELEELTLDLNKNERMLGKFVKAALRKHHKQLAHIILRARGYGLYKDALSLEGGLAPLTALKKMTLSGLVLTVTSAERFLNEITSVKTLEWLKIDSCTASSKNNHGALYLAGILGFPALDSDEEAETDDAEVFELQPDNFRTFKTLTTIILVSVHWAGPFGLAALLRLGDKVEQIVLTDIRAGERNPYLDADAVYTAASFEEQKVELAKPFSLQIQVSDGLADILEVFELDKCSKLDMQWPCRPSYESAEDRIGQYHQALDVLARNITSTTGPCGVLRLHRQGKLSKLRKQTEQGIQSIYNDTVAAMTRLEAAAAEHEVVLNIKDEEICV